MRRAGSGVGCLSLEKGPFFHSFMICCGGFHDLLLEKPSALFMLLGWSLISVVSLEMCFIHPDLMGRLLMF